MDILKKGWELSFENGETNGKWQKTQWLVFWLKVQSVNFRKQITQNSIGWTAILSRDCTSTDEISGEPYLWSYYMFSWMSHITSHIIEIRSQGNVPEAKRGFWQSLLHVAGLWLFEGEAFLEWGQSQLLLLQPHEPDAPLPDCQATSTQQAPKSSCPSPHSQSPSRSPSHPCAPAWCREIYFCCR